MIYKGDVKSGVKKYDVKMLRKQLVQKGDVNNWYEKQNVKCEMWKVRSAGKFEEINSQNSKAKSENSKVKNEK